MVQLFRFLLTGSPDQHDPKYRHLGIYAGFNKVDWRFNPPKIYASSYANPIGSNVGNNLTGVNIDNPQIAMARYNTSACLDTTFGSGGKVATDIEN
jgi:hypothetical protein